MKGLGTARQWHWISSAVCLAALLLFAVTGFTLNHASRIEASPAVTTVEQILPSDIADFLENDLQTRELSPTLRAYIYEQTGERLTARRTSHIEWSEDELYLSLPLPGRDAWLSLDGPGAELMYERIDRGWIAYFNDLHKGRHSGPAWSLFIDLVALCCVVFAVSGLILLYRQQRSRPSTWPLTTLGLLLPVVLMILLPHL